MNQFRDFCKMFGLSLLFAYLWFACAYLSSCAATPAFHLFLLCMFVLVVFFSCLTIFFKEIFSEFAMNLLLVLLSVGLFCLFTYLFVGLNIGSLFLIF